MSLLKESALKDDLLKKELFQEKKLERKIECIVLQEDYGKFTFGPLHRGFGVTLGNSLRRILLSSLPGSSVTCVKIDGILHEFSTIPGVREDTTDIVLNLKKLRLRITSDEVKTLRLEAKGEKVVTAESLEVPAGVEILNPELHIATLVDRNAKLNMEMKAVRGTGYLPAEQQKVEPVIGLIPIDSIFTPVYKVNYAVEEVRVGQAADYERLFIEVWTDRSMRPDEALSEASKILVDHLNQIVHLQAVPGEVEEGPGGEEKSVLSLSIEDLDLSVRSYNCLKRAGILTLGDLVKYSEADIMNVRNFGKKSLDEIKEKIAQYDLSLRKE